MKTCSCSCAGGFRVADGDAVTEGKARYLIDDGYAVVGYALAKASSGTDARMAFVVGGRCEWFDSKDWCDRMRERVDLQGREVDWDLRLCHMKAERDGLARDLERAMEDLSREKAAGQRLEEKNACLRKSLVEREAACEAMRFERDRREADLREASSRISRLERAAKVCDDPGALVRAGRPRTPEGRPLRCSVCGSDPKISSFASGVGYGCPEAGCENHGLALPLENWNDLARAQRVAEE